MPGKVVLDSSVIAAIFFREDDVVSKAEKIIEESKTIYNVDIAIAEITNVAWKKVVFEDETLKIGKKRWASVSSLSSRCLQNHLRK